MSKGKVYLVGGGPGDVGLFTLRGKEVLESAEVVVYDSLVGQGVLALIPKTAKLINVGKRAGNHLVPQDGINEILLQEALLGKQVVRLKGGDPFLFGRGGEELELLIEHDIPFEVVNGVTSAIAVPAYNGIPVTHRDFTSSVHIITGHTRKGEGPSIDFEALVRLNGTLVFLMGITAMTGICEGLMAAGMPKDMPAAVLERGTTSRQRRVVATVSTLVEESERSAIGTPAIIVVGKVCSLADRFAWAEKKPLFGKKIAVCRPVENISRLADSLRTAGAEVVELPTIACEKIADTADFGAALARIDEYGAIALTSPIGVRVFFDKLLECGCDVRKLSKVKFAAIGAATARALRERGLIADIVPKIYDAKHLGEAIVESISAGSKVFIPRAEIGTPVLVETLVAAGIVCDDVAIYSTEYLQDHLNISAALDCDAVAFTSASTVRGFVAAMGDIDFSKFAAFCIGDQTAEEAGNHGFNIKIAEKATIDDMLALIMKEG